MGQIIRGDVVDAVKVLTPDQLAELEEKAKKEAEAKAKKEAEEQEKKKALGRPGKHLLQVTAMTQPKTVKEEDAEFIAAAQAAVNKDPETIAEMAARILRQPLTVTPMLVSRETWNEWLEHTRLLKELSSPVKKK